MPLEDLVGPNKYLDALNRNWPLDSDTASEGNDHISGHKNVVLNTFPGPNGNGLEEAVHVERSALFVAVEHIVDGDQGDGVADHALDQHGVGSQLAQRCQRQGDAVAQGKTGDHDQHIARAPGQQHQAQLEGDVIDADEDVLDAEQGIGAPDVAADSVRPGRYQVDAVPLLVA